MQPAGREICLDLDDFQHDPERLEGFLRNILRETQTAIEKVTLQREFGKAALHLNGNLNMETEKSALKIEFEKALRYVELSVPADPIFKPREIEYLETTGRPEVLLVLYWLKHIKGVERIHDLRVRDSLYHPHQEETIARLKDYYSVDILDWKRPDISIDTVKQAAEQVKDLHLYGTGWASLSHWTGCEGVGAGKLPSVSSDPSSRPDC